MSIPGESVLSAAPQAVAHHSTRKMVAAFAMVYVFWGATFLAIRYGVQTIPPLLMSGSRHLFAGMVLYSAVRLRGTPAPAPRHWRSAAMVGALLLLCANGILATTERVLPSSVAALIVATVSLWMAVIEWLRPAGMRPTARVATGLVCGFLGVALLVSPHNPFFHSRGDAVRLGPALALVCGSLLWASGSILSRHLSLPRSPLLAAAMFMITGGVLLLVAGLVLGQFAALDFHAITLRSALAVIYLAIFGSLLGMSAYVYILHSAAPSRVATYAYVNPIVAVVLGWLVAGEQITLRMLVAAAVIILSVVLVITAPHAPVAEDVAAQATPE